MEIGLAYSKEARIDFVEDLEMSWQEVFHQLQRPLLKGLWKDGVVCVGAGLLRYAPGLQHSCSSRIHHS